MGVEVVRVKEVFCFVGIHGREGREDGAKPIREREGRREFEAREYVF